MVGFVSKFATRRGLTVLLVTNAVVFGTILLTLGQLSDVSGGYGILDFEQGYSPDRVNEILGSYGPEGMSLYNRIQILDVFNPALYSLVAAALTYLLWRGRGKLVRPCCGGRKLFLRTRLGWRQKSRSRYAPRFDGSS